MLYLLLAIVVMSRPARGGWIEISSIFTAMYFGRPSRPARGGWIEIYLVTGLVQLFASRPARGGWIEIGVCKCYRRNAGSRPARGGWIEIERDGRIFEKQKVPPRTGRVD